MDYVRNNLATPTLSRIKLTRSFFLIVMAVVLSGCGASGILKANLDNYPSGTSLDLLASQSIPGAPDGDMTLFVVPNVFVTDTGTDLMTGNSLQINGRVNYTTADHEDPSRYQIYWRGVRNNYLSEDSYIRLLDDSGDPAMNIRFSGGQIFVETGEHISLPIPRYSRIGVHEISITINMSGAPNVEVEIIEDGTTIFNSPASGLDLIDNSFSDLTTVQFESYNTNYFMQDLIVTAHE
ncbi:MAG: hypothetical protein MI867_02140 [Pseudomonadales bacterium]|nr:hypothetical protein [Pseudomonadales bacterium]